MSRVINSNGINLIKHFEGFRKDAYICPAGILTIGYGHTESAKPGQNIDEATAEDLLRQDIHAATKAVSTLVKVPLNDNQFAALVSFTFNCGSGALARSTLCRLLNNGDYDSVPHQLNRWVKAGGETRTGLVKRRQAEGELWTTPIHGELCHTMPQAIDEVEDELYTVNAGSGLRMRDGPGLQNAIIQVLPYNKEVSVLDTHKNWFQVDLNSDGKPDGWVHKDYLLKVDTHEI